MDLDPPTLPGKDEKVFVQELESGLPHRVNNRDVLQSTQHSLEGPPRDPILCQERPDAPLDIHPLGRRNGKKSGLSIPVRPSHSKS